MSTRLILGLFLAFTAGSAGAAGQLPRIGARAAYPAAEFCRRDTGARFVPQGNSHTDYVDHHAYFDVDRYSADAADAMLKQMHGDGYNVVRTFIDPWRVAATDGSGLDQRYMANVISFLNVARANEIYVIFVFGFHPFNTHYNAYLPVPRPPDLQDPNVYLLDAGYFAAKAAYLADFVTAIKQYDSALLSTVFSYEVANELYLTTIAKPFNLSSGLVKTAAGVYDMASSTSRQACMDDNITLFANRMAEAVRAVDPEAMVSASVFSYGAVGKSSPSGLLPIEGYEPAGIHPARPRVLLERTTLSYIDFHASRVSGSYELHTDLETSELRAMDKTRRPLLLGEFSAIKSVYRDNIVTAARDMRAHRASAYDLGFAGALFWAWQPYVDHRFWAAVDEGGAINGQLAPATRFDRPRVDHKIISWDGDSRPDLARVQRTRTQSGHTEVEIAFGAEGYARVGFHAVTPFPEAPSGWEFEMADWDRDGFPDLFGIKKAWTGTGRTEVHIVTAASSFASYVFQLGTAFPLTNDNTDFMLADWDGDRIPDLIGVQRTNTASGRVEVRVASGASQFTSFIYQGTTIFPAGNEMQFTLCYWNLDRLPDLVGVRKFATGTGRTEVHVAAGALTNAFSTYLANTGTVFPPTGVTTDFEMFGRTDGRTRLNDLVAIKKANAPSGFTEVTIAPAPSYATQTRFVTAFGEGE